jgi:aspartate aminotransferase
VSAPVSGASARQAVAHAGATARAAQLRAEGKDIVGLGAGEPDFDTPAHIAEAGIEAIRNGHTRYTMSTARPNSRTRSSRSSSRDNGLDYARNADPRVQPARSRRSTTSCMALLDPGDEVVIPAPYWVSYPDMVLLADGKPVIVYAGRAGLQDHGRRSSRRRSRRAPRC